MRTELRPFLLKEYSMRVQTPFLICRMATILLLSLLFGKLGVNAQNLVPNPGFEATGSIPCQWVTSPSVFSSAVQNWRLPTNGTPDVHATYIAGNCWNAQPMSSYGGFECWRGGQTPRTGQVMIGLFSVVNSGSWREYIQVKLTSPMIPGQAYDVGFYTSLASSSSLATNQLGIHLSTTPISGAWGNLNVTPQVVENSVITDTSNWVWVGATIIPTQAYEFLTIGNFAPNSATNIVQRAPQCDGAYYFIDDVCISLSASATCAAVLDPQLLGFAAETGQGRSVQCQWEVATSTGISHFLLQRSRDGRQFEDLRSIDAHPQHSTYRFQDHFPMSGNSFYRVMQVDQDGGQYLSETREITLDEKEDFHFRVYPNPAQHAPHIVGTDLPGEVADIQVADPAGKVHYMGTHSCPGGQLDVDLQSLLDLSVGMYIVSCKTGGVLKTAFFFVN